MVEVLGAAAALEANGFRDMPTDVYELRRAFCHLGDALGEVGEAGGQCVAIGCGCGCGCGVGVGVGVGECAEGCCVQLNTDAAKSVRAKRQASEDCER